MAVRHPAVSAAAWRQPRAPLFGSELLSAAAAALPLLLLFYLIALRHQPVLRSSAAALISALCVAVALFGMPATLAAAACFDGAAFGIFPVGWIVFSSLCLFEVVEETNHLDAIGASIAPVTTDRRLLALLVAVCFSGFLEGAAGFGTPVAVSSAMLVALGFEPSQAAFTCLLANTSPVAFGSLGTPLLALSGATGLPLLPISTAAARMCAVTGLVTPSYTIAVCFGVRGLLGVLPAVLVASVSFSLSLLVATALAGQAVSALLASLVSMATTLLFVSVCWQPHDCAGERLLARPEREEGACPAAVGSRQSGVAGGATAAGEGGGGGGGGGKAACLRDWEWRSFSGEQQPGWRTRAAAVAPYLLLVLLVLIWRWPPIERALNLATLRLEIPFLHHGVLRSTKDSEPISAVFTLNLASAGGSACLVAAFLSSRLFGMRFRAFLTLLARVARRVAPALCTISIVMALAFLMDFGGLSDALGSAVALSGGAFPLFSPLLGWVGVVLTGSDTSSNALFGRVQTLCAMELGFSPVLAAAANAVGGTMGKMVSLQSIAVAVAATRMDARAGSALFAKALKHAAALAAAVAALTLWLAYVQPGYIPEMAY